MKKNYSSMIRFVYGHYDVRDEFGTFIESCDTYEEAQEVVDRVIRDCTDVYAA